MNDTLRRRLLERDERGRPSFPYVPASETDIRKLFARVMRKQKEKRQ